MDDETLHFYMNWFIKYVDSFTPPDGDEEEGIQLKKQHTFNVCTNIKDLATSLSLTHGEINLALSIALFHDIGRFEQLNKYKTFKDSISVNHGFLGEKILIESKILEGLSYEQRNTVLQSVRYHNAFKIPDLKDALSIFYLKLIRDSDKLDIWRIFKDYFSNDKKISIIAGLGLPDTAGYNVELLNFIYNGQVVPLSKVSNRNDFKIMQISWVFDLNFKWSFKAFKERAFSEMLSTLSQDGEILRFKNFIDDYVNQRIQNG
ncbi:MAG: HD domain-containing protein [Thermodesulfovibrionales bacterium]|nr:HD domain-containing protein [Thermodesulfovibrionales bacterium]